MDKTKIVILMQSMYVGGVERALISLLSVIPAEKYEIDLILSKRKGDFLNRIPAHVNVYEAPYKKHIRSGEGIAEILTKLKQDKRYVSWIKLAILAALNKKINVDKMLMRAIYQNSTTHYDYLFNFAGINTLTNLLSRNVYKADNKYIWVHGDSEKEGFVKYSKEYEVYDHVFCVSEKVTDKFRKYMPSMAQKTDTIYNEIDQDVIRMQAEESTGIERQSDETVLLTVGRLDACKGYNIAIDACDWLIKSGYKVKWYVVGEGIEREKIEFEIAKRELQNCFILLGKKENPYPYYKSTDIYVQTSISEGYCITLAEAKVFNKPIVTTDFSGADEQIIDGRNGYIVTMNGADIAKKIEELIENEEIRVRFSNELKKDIFGSSFVKLEKIMIDDKIQKFRRQ